MTAPAASDAQPGPIPPPQPRTGILGRRLAFREPSPEELDQILSPGSPETTPGEESPAAGADFDSAGPPSEDPGPDESGATGSPGSGTRGGKRPLYASEEVKKTARNAVFLASARAHAMLVRTQADVELQRYIADTEDQANIGDPLANIGARRSGGLVSDNPDVNDGLQAILGLGNYIVKQMQLGMIAKRMHTEAVAPEVIPGEVAG